MEARCRIAGAGLLVAMLATAACQRDAGRGRLDTGMAVQMATILGPGPGPGRGVAACSCCRCARWAARTGASTSTPQPTAATHQQALQSRRILVCGQARLEPIPFRIGNQPSGKYYCQLQVRVSDAGQILLPGEKA